MRRLALLAVGIPFLAAVPASGEGLHFSYGSGYGQDPGVVLLGLPSCVCVGQTFEVYLEVQRVGVYQPIPVSAYDIEVTANGRRVPLSQPPVTDEGAAERYRMAYSAERIGSVKVTMWARMKPEFDAFLSGTVEEEVEVVPCFNGWWQENSRVIEIGQKGDEILAYVVDGAYSCSEGSAEGELDFAATVGGDGDQFESTQGLNVCNPESCVEVTPDLDRMPRRPLKGGLTPDGKDIEVEWDNQYYEHLEDDQEKPCKATEVVFEKESWPRLKAASGPPRPWPSALRDKCRD